MALHSDGGISAIIPDLIDARLWQNTHKIVIVVGKGIIHPTFSSLDKLMDKFSDILSKPQLGNFESYAIGLQHFEMVNAKEGKSPIVGCVFMGRSKFDKV